MYTHYLALQFSGIQKAILRHGRLWSLSGISQMMQRINEINLPDIVKRHRGTVLLASGGKLTASFPASTSEEDLEKLKTEIRLHISSMLPMLEYQVVIHPAAELRDATQRSEKPESPPNLIQKLADEKRMQRGYGVTFSPHLALCEECGEYPVTVKRHEGNSAVCWCSICSNSHDAAESNLHNMVEEQSTFIERLYARYFDGGDVAKRKVPLNFELLFGDKKENEGKRIAVWMSDTNNMGDIVPLWMAQENDGDIKDTLDTVKASNIAIIAQALRDTFSLKEIPGKWLPFRIIIAGGDDLCIVMDEKYILRFAENFAKAHTAQVEQAQGIADHPLNRLWLEKKAGELGKPADAVKPYCFAGCFIVTSLHTPFKKIHEIGEHLLKEAKEKSDRKANSVTWRIMAEDQETVTEQILKNMEKPVFFTDKPPGTAISENLVFNELLNLRTYYSRELSGSHVQMVAGKMLASPDNPGKVQCDLEILASTETPRSFGRLLADNNLAPDFALRTGRLASLFELMSIGGNQ